MLVHLIAQILSMLVKSLFVLKKIAVMRMIHQMARTLINSPGCHKTTWINIMQKVRHSVELLMMIFSTCLKKWNRIKDNRSNQHLGIVLNYVDFWYPNLSKMMARKVKVNLLLVQLHYTTKLVLVIMQSLRLHTISSSSKHLPPKKIKRNMPLIATSIYSAQGVSISICSK